MVPIKTPLIKPTAICFLIIGWLSRRRNSPIARLRITTESVCEPALPPNPAIIGMMAANTATFAIVDSNCATIMEDKNAVAKLTISQGTRLVTELQILESSRSSLLTPDIMSMSSVCSSIRTSIISSMVMIPNKAPRRLVTGITCKSYFDTISDTSSWSVSVTTLIGLGSIISESLSFASAANRFRRSTVPNRRCV